MILECVIAAYRQFGDLHYKNHQFGDFSPKIANLAIFGPKIAENDK